MDFTTTNRKYEWYTLTYWHTVEIQIFHSILILHATMMEFKTYRYSRVVPVFPSHRQLRFPPLRPIRCRRPWRLEPALVPPAIRGRGAHSRRRRWPLRRCWAQRRSQTPAVEWARWAAGPVSFRAGTSWGGRAGGRKRSSRGGPRWRRTWPDYWPVTRGPDRIRTLRWPGWRAGLENEREQAKISSGFLGSNIILA